MANNIYSAKAIQKRFNLSETQFRREYNAFSRRVANLNRIAGTNYSAIREYRFSKLFPDTTTIKSINSIPTTKNASSDSAMESVKDYLENRFDGLMNANPKLKEKFDSIGQNGYSVSDFAKDAKQFGDSLNESRHNDPVVNSENYDSDTPVSDGLIEENRNIDFDDELYD